MTLQSVTDENIQKVVRTYSFIHKLFFGLGLTLCGIIVAVAIGSLLFSNALRQSSFLRNESSLQVEQETLATMRSILDGYTSYEGIQILIKQGFLSLTGESIVTIDNLLSYKGLVIPRVGNISLAAALPSVEMLTGENYRSDDLVNYIQNTILTYPDTRTLSDKNITLLSFGSSLINYFGISCILTPKVTDRFCQQALVGMVDVLPVYDLSQDPEGLEKIATALQQTKSHTLFCDAMKRYIFFSHDTSESIKNSMYTCGLAYERSYNDFASFRSVQEQLDKQSINATIALNPLINAYKLISTQQAIYYEMSNRRINDVRIRAYLKYNEELLRRPESIQTIYFDVIAWFNNHYLIPSLMRLYFQQKGQESTDIKALLESIRMINDGNNVLAYPGLSQMVKDKTLIVPRGQTLIGSGVVIRPLLDIFHETYSFPHFLITKQSSGENDTLTVQGSRVFDTNVGLASKVNSSLSLIYDGVRFRIKKATFSGFPRVEQGVNTLLTTQAMTFAELYDLLINNAVTFNRSQLGLCDIVRTLGGYISCDSQKIVFSGYPLSGGKVVTYTITHKDGLLSAYTIDDTALDKAVHDQLGVPQTTTLTMFSFIQVMLTIRLEKTNTNFSTQGLSGAADMIEVRQSFVDIGAKVEMITPQGTGISSVAFTIKTITCIARYDIAKQSIIALDIVRNDMRYPIRGFTLSLASLQSPQVQAFANDPRSVMSQFDPLTVKKSGI